MRTVVYKGRQFEVYAVVKYKNMMMILTKLTGKEKEVHRPVPIERLLDQNGKCIYHDASIEKLIVKPQPYVYPYYEGMKWLKCYLHNESDFRVLSIENTDSIVALKKEEVF